MNIFQLFLFLSRSKRHSTAFKSNTCEKIGEKYVTSWLNGQVFHVETILGKRQQNGSTEYLVKWREWSNHFNSWESEESIQNGSKPKERKYEVEITDQEEVIRFWQKNCILRAFIPRKIFRDDKIPGRLAVSLLKYQFLQGRDAT